MALVAGVPGRGHDPERRPEEVVLDTADKQNVLQQAQDNNVQFIRMWFTDILGTLKSFAITVEELEDALDGGMGFDGSSITGYQDIEESDMIAMPDPSTVPGHPLEPAGRPHRAHDLRRADHGRRPVRRRPAPHPPPGA
jgi:glutamine synthetase